MASRAYGTALEVGRIGVSGRPCRGYRLHGHPIFAGRGAPIRVAQSASQPSHALILRSPGLDRDRASGKARIFIDRCSRRTRSVLKLFEVKANLLQ
jgi:hypothetical protein